MSQLTAALEQVGVDLGESSINAAIDAFNIQNLSPSDIYQVSQVIASTVGGAQTRGIPTPSLAATVSIGGGGGGGGVPSVLQGGTGGEWESVHYADDLNSHHAKFKFLFKVKFEGFGTESFYYFVHRCDKPRVRFNHQDVNYYNFRTKVLTSVTYDPLSITFLDEIGNSVNQFFVNYMKKRTGTADGKYGIDKGFGTASSSKPYDRGYSDAGAKVIIEQVFANGQLSNRYEFINARIESFDFDELSMEDNSGSMLTCTFSYDAISMYTVSQSVQYTWGDTDLLRGGGTSGAPNAGSTSLGENGGFSASFAGGSGIGGSGGFETRQPGVSYSNLQGGTQLLNQIPPSLSDLVNPAIGLFSAGFNQLDIVGSATDRIQRGIQETLGTIRSGANLVFGGLPSPSTVSNLISSNVPSIPNSVQSVFNLIPPPPSFFSDDP